MPDPDVALPDLDITAARPQAPTPTPPSGMSWTQKQINITITLGTGTFGQTGQNTVELSGLRVVANIQKYSFPSLDHAEVRVYGVQPSVMNAVSTLGIPLNMWRNGNTMLIEAGDSVAGMSIVFTGYLRNAYQDFDESPETSMHLVGFGGQLQAIAPAAPTSYPGTADVATIMANIATRAGWQFSNSGVQVSLSNQYCPGTALQQAHDVARAANIIMYLDNSTQPPTLRIAPKNGSFNGLVPLIGAASGLIGYPKFSSNGMSFRCLFNPSLQFQGKIIMQSTAGNFTAPVTVAQVAESNSPSQTVQAGPNGEWVITALNYNLATQIPDGPWFCEAMCARTAGPSP